MCEDDKESFRQNIHKTSNLIKKMAVPIEWTEYETFPKTLDSALHQYTADVGSIEMGDMTASETAQAGAWLKDLEKQIAAGVEKAQNHG